MYRFSHTELDLDQTRTGGGLCHSVALSSKHRGHWGHAYLPRPEQKVCQHEARGQIMHSNFLQT